MTEISGDLEGIGLSQLIKFLGALNSTGELALEEAPFTGKLYFENGQVRGAQFGSEEGVAALEAIALTLGPGRFAFSSVSDEPALHNLDFEGDGVITELERLTVHAEHYRRLMPPLSATPVPIRSKDRMSEPVTLERGALQLLLDCNGRTTVAELVRNGSMLSTLKNLSQLVEFGLLECQPVERTRPQAPRTENGHASPRSQRPASATSVDDEQLSANGAPNRAGLTQAGSRWKWR